MITLKKTDLTLDDIRLGGGRSVYAPIIRQFLASNEDIMEVENDKKVSLSSVKSSLENTLKKLKVDTVAVMVGYNKVFLIRCVGSK